MIRHALGPSSHLQQIWEMIVFEIVKISFVSWSSSEVLEGKGKKWKRVFPWLVKAQSFSCETQYP